MNIVFRIQPGHGRTRSLIHRLRPREPWNWELTPRMRCGAYQTGPRFATIKQSDRYCTRCFPERCTGCGNIRGSARCRARHFNSMNLSAHINPDGYR